MFKETNTLSVLSNRRTKVEKGRKTMADLVLGCEVLQNRPMANYDGKKSCI
jgi:hypothetical protein